MGIILVLGLRHQHLRMVGDILLQPSNARSTCSFRPTGRFCGQSRGGQQESCAKDKAVHPGGGASLDLIMESYERLGHLFASLIVSRDDT